MPTLEYSIAPDQLNVGCDSKSFIYIDILEKRWYHDWKFLTYYDQKTLKSIDGQIRRGEVDRHDVKVLLKAVFERAQLSESECASVINEIFAERREGAIIAKTPFAMRAHEESFAQAAAGNGAPDLQLPLVAPERYEHRRRPESPIAYYDRVWRTYADVGILFQDQLRKLDPKLIPAVHTYCSRHGIEPRDHLPPPRVERTRKLAASGDTLAQQRINQAAIMRERRERGISP